MPHCTECGHDWSRDVDIMAERTADLRNERDELRDVLKTALNEIHHPGACAYERGQNITGLIARTLANTEKGSR